MDQEQLEQVAWLAWSTFARCAVSCCAEEPGETIQEGTELSTSVSLASTGGLEPAAAAAVSAAAAVPAADS